MAPWVFIEPANSCQEGSSKMELVSWRCGFVVLVWVIHSLFLMSSAKVTRSLFFKFRHLLTGAKWFLCTQSFWKNNIKLSFLRCPALRRIPLSQSHHQIEFPSYCKWLSNPSTLKDPLPATLLRSMISAVKVLFVPRSFRLGCESFCLCHGVFVCALRVFVRAVRVFVFAAAPVGHHIKKNTLLPSLSCDKHRWNLNSIQHAYRWNSLQNWRESEDLDNKEWKELLDVGIDMCRRAVPDWYRLSFQTKTMLMLKMANKHEVIKHRHNFQFRVLLMRENKSIASAGSWNKSIWGVMATKHGFLGVPVISLFLLLQAVFCYYHVRNCSTLVKGYYLDFYLQSSSFKELLLPPLYISSQMRPWQRIASTIHFPQSVWTKYGYSSLSALDVHSDTDIKIFMDVSSIPEPR